MTALKHEITGLLLKWSNGDARALDELVPVIYPELRRIARRFMSREKGEHTLQTSALINEAYLRLVDQQRVNWESRSHFLSVASQVMRHILIDHARRYLYAKRGAGAEHVPLEETAVVAGQRAVELVGLDDALSELAKFDERKFRIVELRYFGGLTVEETAEVLKLSPITIKREWRTARAWLMNEILGPQ